MSQVTIGNQQNAEMFNYLFNNQNNPMPLEFLRLFNGYREYAKAREMFELWNMWKYLENNPSAHPRDLRQVIGGNSFNRPDPANNWLGNNFARNMHLPRNSAQENSRFNANNRIINTRHLEPSIFQPPVNQNRQSSTRINRAASTPIASSPNSQYLGTVEWPNAKMTNSNFGTRNNHFSGQMSRQHDNARASRLNIGFVDRVGVAANGRGGRLFRPASRYSKPSQFKNCPISMRINRVASTSIASSPNSQYLGTVEWPNARMTNGAADNSDRAFAQAGVESSESLFKRRVCPFDQFRQYKRTSYNPFRKPSTPSVNSTISEREKTPSDNSSSSESLLEPASNVESAEDDEVVIISVHLPSPKLPKIVTDEPMVSSRGKARDELLKPANKTNSLEALRAKHDTERREFAEDDILNIDFGDYELNSDDEESLLK